MNIKINNFKVNKSITTKFIPPRLSNISPDLHVSTKINIFILYKVIWEGGVGGGGGATAPEAILKKIKQNGGLSYKVKLFFKFYFYI